MGDSDSSSGTDDSFLNSQRGGTHSKPAGSQSQLVGHLSQPLDAELVKNRKVLKLRNASMRVLGKIYEVTIKKLKKILFPIYRPTPPFCCWTGLLLIHLPGWPPDPGRPVGWGVSYYDA